MTSCRVSCRRCVSCVVCVSRLQPAQPGGGHAAGAGLCGEAVGPDPAQPARLWPRRDGEVGGRRAATERAPHRAPGAGARPVAHPHAHPARAAARRCSQRRCRPAVWRCCHVNLHVIVIVGVVARVPLHRVDESFGCLPALLSPLLPPLSHLVLRHVYLLNIILNLFQLVDD